MERRDAVENRIEDMQCEYGHREKYSIHRKSASMGYGGRVWEREAGSVSVFKCGGGGRVVYQRSLRFSVSGT